MERGTVLLAGATGYLGAYTAKELQTRGFKVRALVRKQSDAQRLSAEGSEAVVGDVTQGPTLRGAADGCCAVVSALGMRGPVPAGVGGFMAAVEKLYREGLVELFEEAVRAGTCKQIVVVASTGSALRESSAVSAREDAIHHIQKRCAELQQQQGGGKGSDDNIMSWTVLEPSAFFKDLDHMYSRTAVTGKAMLFGAGLDKKFNPIHGSDLASRLVDCLQHKEDRNRRVPVGGPEIFTFREVYAMIGERAGVDIKYSSVPMWLVNILLPLLRLLGKLAPRAQRIMFFVEFLRSISSHDSVGEPYGTHHVRPYLDTLGCSGAGVPG